MGTHVNASNVVLFNPSTQQNWSEITVIIETKAIALPVNLMCMNV